MSDLALFVNGARYGGWKSVRVTRSIESLAGSFDLDVSDRWAGQEEPWPIIEEDACRVEIDGVMVLDGYVDRRRPALAGMSRTLSFSGRDRAAALVDCSAILNKWTFRNASVLDMATKLAEPFGIVISLQPGILAPKPEKKIVVNPGDSPYQAIQRAAAASGYLLVSDGSGGAIFTRAGARRAATPLVQGQNVLSAAVDYDATERFYRYVIVTQMAGTDAAAGEATRIRAEATDQGVRRTNRMLMIRPEAGLTTASARQRADWEARIRAAKAETVTVAVQGWQQPGGELWPLNAIVAVHVPAMGVDGDLLISELELSMGDGGQITQMKLVRPDAFIPEPKAVVGGKGTKGLEWKELAHGVDVPGKVK